MPATPDHHRMSVAALLTPEFHGFTEVAMMREQTPARMLAVWPDKLYANLVGSAVSINWGLNGPGQQAVEYGWGMRRTRIALAAKERLIYAYSFEGLGNKANLTARTSEKGKFVASGDVEAPTRASIHAVESRVESMQKYRGALNVQGSILKRLVEGLQPQNRGLARFGSEEKASEVGAVLIDVVIANMLDALADQRSWTPGQQEMAKQSILARMLADRTKNRHLNYTLRLSNMLLSYQQDKSNAFRYKIERGQRYILDNGPKTIV